MALGSMRESSQRWLAGRVYLLSQSRTLTLCTFNTFSTSSDSMAHGNLGNDISMNTLSLSYECFQSMSKSDISTGTLYVAMADSVSRINVMIETTEMHAPETVPSAYSLGRFLQKSTPRKFLVNELPNIIIYIMIRIFTRFHFARIKPNKQARSLEDEEFEQIKQQVKDQHLKELYEQLENQSVLTKFRKAVFERTNVTKEQQQMADTMQEYDHKLKQILKTGSKAQIVSKSRKLVERFINNKHIFSNKSKNALVSDYGDYAAYKANQTKIVNRRISEQDSLDTNRIARGYKFIESLGPEYIEYQAVRQVLDEEYKGRLTVEEYAKQIQFEEDTYKQANNYIEQHREVSDTVKDGMNDTYQEQTYAPGVPENTGCMSLAACDEIYELYMEGWTVRDISKRYGIHPARTKVIVFSRATAYNEIYPKLGFQYYKNCIEEEIARGTEFGFIDYGLDLDDMAGDSQISDRITSWNHEMTDIARQSDEERYHKAIQKLEKRQQFDKYHMLIVKTHGKENKMYYLKDWKINRGKGSDYWHLTRNTFKQLFKNKGRRFYC